MRFNPNFDLKCIHGFYYFITKGELMPCGCELIVKEESHRLQIHALQSMRGKAHSVISQAMIQIKLKEGLTPLVKRMNDMLIGTIHYQYWDES